MLHAARDDYVAGAIDVDELERRVEAAVALDDRPPRPHDCDRDGHIVQERVEVTKLGSPVREFIGDPACHVCGAEP